MELNCEAKSYRSCGLVIGGALKKYIMHLIIPKKFIFDLNLRFLHFLCISNENGNTDSADIYAHATTFGREHILGPINSNNNLINSSINANHSSMIKDNKSIKITSKEFGNIKDSHVNATNDSITDLTSTIPISADIQDPASVSFKNDTELFNETDVINSLITKYRGKLICCQSSYFPHCDIFLCGTLHVAKTSAEMVKEVVSSIRPHFVLLELCESRIDNLLEVDDINANLTISEVMSNSWKDKSIKTFGMGLLVWMQLKAAKVMGSKLGGELSMAATEANKIGSPVVLGDRLYSVTIQRIFDKLTMSEKIKMVFIVIWEVITMSLFKIKDYIRKTEDDVDFIKDEIERFGKYLPAFAKVIISERDEYLSQSIIEIAKVGFGRTPPVSSGAVYSKKGKILAVVGAGHLMGIRHHLMNGGVSKDRINEISLSSKQASTWYICFVYTVRINFLLNIFRPGEGMLHVLNPDLLAKH